MVRRILPTISERVDSPGTQGLRGPVCHYLAPSAPIWVSYSVWLRTASGYGSPALRPGAQDGMAAQSRGWRDRTPNVAPPAATSRRPRTSRGRRLPRAFTANLGNYLL